jgi:glycosyltransferase involved in cell wall biosynthesis
VRQEPIKVRPLRVVHLLGSLSYGGIETWLMHVLRQLDRQQVAIDVVTTEAELGDYAHEAESLGCRVRACPLRPRLWSYGHRLKALLRQGQYDIVHSHHYLFSGYHLKVAAEAGVPLRIAHIHPTRDWQERTLRRRVYTRLMTRWINRYGNCFIGASRATAESFWGPRWEDDPRRHFLYCGIDLRPFAVPDEPGRFRQELGLPLGCPVVLTVARFAPHKNHRGLVEIAERVLRHVPDTLFILAGDGPTLPEIRSLVSQMGLDRSFIFLQRRSNLVPLWKTADAFVFPSLEEGLGMVVLEAAAAGLPVVASDIPGVREAALSCSEVTLVRPQDVDGFAEATICYLRTPRRYPPDPQKLAAFSIESSVEALVQIYSDALQAVGQLPVGWEYTSALVGKGSGTG